MIGRKRNQFFKNIEGLRNQGVSIQYTQEQINELSKCRDDPIYFCNNYVKIRSLDHEDSIPFKTYGFQDRILNSVHTNNKVVVMMGRQQGKTLTICSYILHAMLFRSKYFAETLAYDLKSACSNLNLIKSMYEEIPFWMQQGIVKWSEKTIVFENGSQVRASATTRSGIRGRTCNLVHIDEIAFIESGIANDFLTSSYPVIFTGKRAKIIITSTPIGYNHFYHLWKDAEAGKNGFLPIKVHYSEHPDRDEAWAEEQLKLLKRRAFNQEVLCSFLGSSNTLISGDALQSLSSIDPIKEKGSLTIYEHPVPDHTYTVTVDTAEGIQQDRSAFSVIDITQRPYKIVARYYDDSISYLLFPDVIRQVAYDYNQAYVLVETNSVGNQVAVILMNDLEYDNVLRFISEPKKGQILSRDARAKYGIVMSSKVKSIGCRALKTLIEEDMLIINDSEIINELNNFVEVGATYKAAEGYHDDLVMTLVSFAYLTQDKRFQDFTDTSRQIEFKDQIERLSDEVKIPITFYFDNGEETEIEDVDELVGF